MKNTILLLSISFALILLLSGCGSGGSGGTQASTTPTLPASDTLIADQTLPGTTYPHQIDYYIPADATRAIVFLHGALGHNYSMAYQLGINTIDSPPTSATVNWSWLDTHQVLAVFPQGQAIATSPNAYTWSNHVMTSGQDDMAFLQALVSYIKTQYGISNLYLAGHSNGGMMANRVWCENPGLFNAYIAMSGPPSDYYYISPPLPLIPAGYTGPALSLPPYGPTASCNPSIVKPYFGIVGSQDTELQIATYGFTSPTYAISNTLASGPAVLDKVLIGEWYQQAYVRVPLMCHDNSLQQPGAAASPTLSDGSTYDTWVNCNGTMQLTEILGSGHGITALQTASGSQMIDLIINFIDQLPS